MLASFGSGQSSCTDPSWNCHLHFLTALSHWMSCRFKRILNCGMNFPFFLEKALSQVWPVGTQMDCSLPLLPKDENVQPQRLLGRCPQPLRSSAPRDAWLRCTRARSIVRPCRAHGMMEREEPYWATEWVTLKNVLPSRRKTCALKHSWKSL